MSDSDDSDDSGLPFDVEIEKCEKRLQLARYKKKYRNEWDYITNRWQNKHIHIVLKDIEQKWRVYSAGSHGSINSYSQFGLRGRAPRGYYILQSFGFWGHVYLTSTFGCRVK